MSHGVTSSNISLLLYFFQNPSNHQVKRTHSFSLWSLPFQPMFCENAQRKTILPTPTSGTLGWWGPLIQDPRSDPSIWSPRPPLQDAGIWSAIKSSGGSHHAWCPNWFSPLKPAPCWSGYKMMAQMGSAVYGSSLFRVARGSSSRSTDPIMHQVAPLGFHGRKIWTVPNRVNPSQIHCLQHMIPPDIMATWNCGLTVYRRWKRGFGI